MRISELEGNLIQNSEFRIDRGCSIISVYGSALVSWANLMKVV